MKDLDLVIHTVLVHIMTNCRVLAVASVSWFIISPEDAKKLLKSQCPTDAMRFNQLTLPISCSPLKTHSMSELYYSLLSFLL